ncbi:MAG: lysophospholipid acyltransferase family protein [Fidelibacterota bacterium]
MTQRFLFTLGVHLGEPVLRLLFKLNRHEIIHPESLEKVQALGKSIIFCCWHGRSLFPLYFLRNRGVYVLAGLHRDAEIFMRVGVKMGWNYVRGSSTRGAVRAYKALVDVLSRPGELVGMAPDGPKGPKQKIKPGAVKTAMKTGAVIIPISGQASRRWEIKSWDAFVVPKPFGRISFVFGEPMEIRPDADIDDSCLILEQKLNTIQEKADALSLSKV